MPVAPTFKANVSLRYEFEVAGLKAFAQGAGFYQSSSRSLLAVADEAVAGPMPGYSTFDISTGAGKGNWKASLSAENLFGSHGEISRYLVCNPSFCTTPYIVPVKPRTLTLQFGQKF